MNIIRIGILVILCLTGLTTGHRHRQKRPYRRKSYRHDLINGQKIPSWIVNNPMYYQAFQDYIKSYSKNSDSFENTYVEKYPSDTKSYSKNNDFLENPYLRKLSSTKSYSKISDSIENPYLEKFHNSQTGTQKPTFPPHPAGYYQTLEDYAPNQMTNYMQMAYPALTNNNFQGQYSYPPKNLPYSSMPQYLPGMYNAWQQKYVSQNREPIVEQDEQEESLDSLNMYDNQLPGTPKYLLPLLMLGVGLPALGFMYIMMSGGGRSLAARNGQNTDELFLEVQRALNTYLHLKKKKKNTYKSC